MDAKSRLVEQLRGAYSGELAAALAYRGHIRSVSSPEEKAALRQILSDELHHRRQVGAMLTSLGSGPDARRERRLFRIGTMLGRLCGFTGWLAPNWGAGRLESKNILEYEDAAVSAHQIGRDDLVDPLLEMAEVEWDHEAHFRATIRAHRLAALLPLWPAPEPRASIRERFVRRTAASAQGMFEGSALTRD